MPDGSIRICDDYKITSNCSTLAKKCPIKKIEDIYAQHGTIRYFSILDIEQVCQQFELIETANTTTTISTHQGLCRCKSIHSVAAIFQRTVEYIMTGLPNTC
ncbi:unnamed protein product, partial [Dicrocoelium dendriticum]